jgi:hypothetical protein
MNRDQFIRALRTYSRKNGVECKFEPRHGKGGHGRIWVGGKFTTVPSGELKRFTIEEILKQLGLPKDAI